ncbi:MAG: DNA polymerase I [Thermodesulfovibrionales bacterium]|nr:DNA polymerase I [Thermodesulfovibrionales bacterium]
MNLYLIDGNSYVYRAFYAIKGLTNSKGFPTNAIYGFTTTLLKIIREKKPDGVAIFFDTPELTERHRIFKEYKAQRPETPNELVRQLPHIREMITAFNISIFEMPGYEADDLIGTVAKEAGKKRSTVFIVTADKDMLQLVDENIKIYDPVKDRILDSEYVKEKFGVEPEKVPEFMALTGDAADNIPGIKGIGEKTAKELFTAFKGLEELLSHPEMIKKEKLRSLISENADVARLSKKLATIDIDVPVDFDMREFRLKEPDWHKLLSLFSEFEFASLKKLVPSIAAAGKKNYEAVLSIDKLKEIVSSIKNEFAFDVEATGKNPMTDSVVGFSISIGKETGYYIPLRHSYLGAPKQIGMEEALDIITPVFENPDIAKIGHNLKYDTMMLRQEGVTVKGRLYDTMLASYLVNPNKPNHSLEDVAFEHLSRRKKTFQEVLNKKNSFADVFIEEATRYSAEDALLSFELKDILFEKIRERALEGVYFDIEAPLIHVLSDMEEAGVKIDADKLNDISKELARELDSIQRRVYFLSGEEFNINSPKQLAKVLFHSLGLKPGKKTKTGFSTDVSVLEELAMSHELPREILNWRSLSKLKATYVDALPALINPKTGRVHTSFNQTATATGRLSSSDPNLQNIPIKGEWGRRIRETFIADKDNILLSADYSQVELRILAHLSKDEVLIEAFSKGIDVHAKTASEIFGVTVNKVTGEMRRTAKTVNFGVIYGMSAFGLSVALSIPQDEAKKYIERYFERHPGVKKYIEGAMAEARQKGCTVTLAGRRRPIPEMRSQNSNARAQAERLAVNSPIQGSAADIIKIAMINIREKLKGEHLTAKMILQVHDELLFEAPESELNLVGDMIKREMEGAVKLMVPLKVDIGHGRNWAEAPRVKSFNMVTEASSVES